MRLAAWLGSLLKRIQAGRTGRTRPYRERFFPDIRVTRLEPRCVLNAGPVPVTPPVAPLAPPTHTVHTTLATDPNVLVVAAPDTIAHSSQAAKAPDIVKIVRDGKNIDVFFNGSLQESAPYSRISAIDVIASGGPETLLVDFSGGSPLPSGGLIFVGGAATSGDSLIIEGGSAQSVNFTLAAGGDGTVAIDGATISYSGVPNVVDRLNAVTTDIALVDGGRNDTLANAPQPGLLVFGASDGTQVTFADPTGALVIDTQVASNAAADTLQLGNLDLRSSGQVSVLARSADTVIVTGGVEVGHGSLLISAGVETLSGTIEGSAAAVDLRATASISVSAGGVI
ncbi:MAG TPA: hypothetical protein VKU82_12490, partial [Planctomycetaceae bacterium]|nr:hypothetical protein [Planctomycetaceae bacterium]